MLRFRTTITRKARPGSMHGDKDIIRQYFYASSPNIATSVGEAMKSLFTGGERQYVQKTEQMWKVVNIHSNVVDGLCDLTQFEAEQALTRCQNQGGDCYLQDMTDD